MNYPTGDNLTETEINRYYGDDTIYDYENRKEEAEERKQERNLRKHVKNPGNSA